MKLKRLLLCALAALAIASCGGGWEETLLWEAAIDIPMNFSRDLTVQDIERLQPPGGVAPDSVFWDLGTENVLLTSDFMDVLKKTTEQKVGYWLRVYNKTGADLILYGMIFDGDDAAFANWDGALLRGQATNKDLCYLNIFGPEGLRIAKRDSTERRLPLEKKGTVADTTGKQDTTANKQDTTANKQDTTASKQEPTPEEQEQMLALRNILMQRRSIGWRWMALINKNGGAVAADTGSVDIKLLINFSGVNCSDSLSTL
jgi:hypothetical protein